MNSYFKRILLTLAYVFIAYSDLYGDAQKDESDIRQISKEYSTAFSKQDPEALASFWTSDAVYINPITGMSIQGHDALVENFKDKFEDDKADKLEITISEIQFPEPGKAIEKGVFRLTYADGKPTLQNAFSVLLVKEGDRWLYKEARQIHLDMPPSNYEKLKELEWMVGDWIDADDDVTIETQTKWDSNKNFIIQKFTMQLYDQNVLEGQQIIGWDPTINKIRSWIFDSDGGFGTGVWYNKENRWVVTTVYTLSNGGKASAVNIYTKISEDAYTWASEGRDVNGEILPNIKSIKIVRKKEKGNP